MSPDRCHRARLVVAGVVDADVTTGRPGPAPYGTARGEDGRLEPDHDEAPRVAEMFRIYAHGRSSVRDVVRHAHRRGWRTRSGAHWRIGAVGRVLANRAYVRAGVVAPITYNLCRSKALKKNRKNKK